ncbi:type II toxin-antitoxin system VapC family toxin [uncultured Microbacterium sp.]|uniref:type II toxin-antitoxin system VapC family toxin n=1 Tax=uncultured Microbacterium sp. TaxID=191216 RepID=UPI002619D7B5|nr:type II toxin-antitoxin system VapC family toxin [uncultured Microbacterium sp.]
MAIVVDSSAIAAIVFGEADAPALSAVLRAHAGAVQVSAATVLEARMVVQARQGDAATTDLDRLLHSVDAEVVAFDDRQSALAFAAWRRFGRGRHAASLDFGDCISYALAKSVGVPLLYKGDDFAQTDVSSAL